MGLRRNIRNAFDTIIADVCGSETYLPEDKKPYTKNQKNAYSAKSKTHGGKKDGRKTLLFVLRIQSRCG